MKKLILFSLISFFSCSGVLATHLKGGKITYDHVGGLTYRIILTGYTDGESPVSFGSNGTIDFGDGQTGTIPQDGTQSGTRVDENTYKHEFEFLHTYSSGGSYLISYQEYNRNEGVLNMQNQGSVPFYIETQIEVDPLISNSSVKLLRDPNFLAYLNQTYHYNPKAFDIDGDSLSFHLAVPMQGKDQQVPAYVHPQQVFNREGGSESGGYAYFSIDRATGDLVWDAPVRIGEYSVAIEVREWRKFDNEYILVGRVIQDVQIRVRNPEEEALELVFPGEKQEIFLEADTPWETTIRAIADNPDDTVVLQLYGNFLGQSPQLTPSDSVAGKGEVAVSLSYSSFATANKKFQLIALAYIYSREEGMGPYRNRAVYLLTPGYISGYSDLPVKRIAAYPNPTNGNQFYLDYPLLNGKEVKISLFAPDGRMVYQKDIPSFSIKDPIHPAKELLGLYLVHIQQGVNSYFSRVIFSK